MRGRRFALLCTFLAAMLMGGFVSSSSSLNVLGTDSAAAATGAQAAVAEQAGKKNPKGSKGQRGGTVPAGSRGLIALTFDDGPTPLTPRFLDHLRAKGVKATFFLQGSNVVTHPDIVRRIHAEGHVIGNHGWSHRTFDELTAAEARDEIVRTNEAIRAITGETPVLFRYPHGVETADGNQVIRDLGMWGGVLWHWESGPGDYTCPGHRGVQDYLATNAVDQALLLLHDGNEVESCPSNQPNYLPKAIDSLRRQGFEFGIVATAGGPSWVNQYSWVRVIPAS